MLSNAKRYNAFISYCHIVWIGKASYAGVRVEYNGVGIVTDTQNNGTKYVYTKQNGFNSQPQYQVSLDRV